MTETTRNRLIREYTELSGESPTPMVNAIIDSVERSEEYYEWRETENQDFKYILAKFDPFDLGDGEPTSFKVEKPSDHAESPFDLEEVPEGEAQVPTTLVHDRVLKEILPEDKKDQLLINHDTGDFSSSKNVLDGFTIERLLECYAEGITDEVISKYLTIRPSQLKRWIAMSTQRMVLIQRLNDIIRSEKVNSTITTSLDYEPGKVFDKQDGQYQSLLLDAVKMKFKGALDLDSRSRIKDATDERALPIVNLGLQVQINNNGGEEGSPNIVPVIPTIVADS